MQEHHILYSRRLWNAQAPTKYLRNHISLRPMIPTDDHRDLHKVTSIVPPPDHFMADRIQRFYNPSDTPLKSVANLLFAIEEATASPKASEFEVALGQIILATIEMQVPFLEEARYRR